VFAKSREEPNKGVSTVFVVYGQEKVQAGLSVAEGATHTSIRNAALVGRTEAETQTREETDWEINRSSKHKEKRRN
jgi:hypothetical protein